MSRFHIHQLIALSALVLAGCGGGGGGISMSTSDPMTDRMTDPMTVSTAIIPPPNQMTVDVATLRDNDEFRLNYGMAQVRTEYAHARGYFGQGVTVAVVDTAIMAKHTDLDANIVPGYDESLSLSVRASHGTNVAGIIAAENNGEGLIGVAPRAKIISLDNDDPLDSAEKFDQALKGGAIAINNSWGFVINLAVLNTVTQKTLIVDLPLYHNVWADIPILMAARPEDRDPTLADRFNFTGNDFGTHKTVADALVESARTADAVWVWGGGNHGWQPNGNVQTAQEIACGLHQTSDDCRSPIVTVSVTELLGGDYVPLLSVTITPGGVFTETTVVTLPHESVTLKGYPSVGIDYLGELPWYDEYSELESRWLAVVSTDERGVTLADYSTSCGPRSKWWCLAAPGVNVSSAHSKSITSYLDGSGTSFSAPYVTGALAVLKGRMPDMPMNVIRAILLRTATPLNSNRVDDVYGWGLLNLQNAIEFQGSLNIASVARPDMPGNSGANLAQTKINLPSGFADVRGRLANVSVAVAAVGNAHYNTGLNHLTEVVETSRVDLTDAGREMLYEPSQRYESGVLFAAVDTGDIKAALYPIYAAL